MNEIAGRAGADQNWAATAATLDKIVTSTRQTLTNKDPSDLWAAIVVGAHTDITSNDNGTAAAAHLLATAIMKLAQTT